MVSKLKYDEGPTIYRKIVNEMKHLLYYNLDADFVSDQVAAGGDGEHVATIIDGVAWCKDTENTYYYEPLEKNYFIKAVYRKTSSSPQNIFQGSEFISHLRLVIIDGTLITPQELTNTYTFTGQTQTEHVIQYKFNAEVQSLYDLTFDGCDSLIGIELPETLTELTLGCFRNCIRLTGITIPDSVLSIGARCFYSAISLTSIILPNTITILPEYCFYKCTSLTSVTLSTDLTSLGDACFAGCSFLTAITIPNKVTTLVTACFQDCPKLKNIVLPDSVKTIGERCFWACTGLTNVTLGSGITSIGENCFYRCSGLTKIVSNAVSAPSVVSNTFREIRSGGILIVPNNANYSSWLSKNTYYLGYYNWAHTVDYIEAVSSITTGNGITTNFTSTTANTPQVIILSYYVPSITGEHRIVQSRNFYSQIQTQSNGQRIINTRYANMYNTSGTRYNEWTYTSNIKTNSGTNAIVRIKSDAARGSGTAYKYVSSLSSPTNNYPIETFQDYVTGLNGMTLAADSMSLTSTIGENINLTVFYDNILPGTRFYGLTIFGSVDKKYLDLIPALRDGTYGLYDSVSGNFYTCNNITGGNM